MAIIVASSLAQPANFLELCKRTLIECGVTADVANNITTVNNQSGEIARIIDYVREAYTMIQNKHPYSWVWLWRETSQSLASGKRIFNPATEWGLKVLKWDSESFKLYLTANGVASEYYLDWWDDWRLFNQAFNRGVIQTSQPSVIVERPDKSLQLDTILQSAYTLSAQYYAAAEILTKDNDVPSMPEQYFLAIVWLATMSYAKYEEAGVLFNTTANTQYAAIMAQMEQTELPQITFSGALC